MFDIPRWSSWRSCRVDILAATFGAPLRRCRTCRPLRSLPLQRLVAQSSIWRQSPLFRRRKFFPRPEISELLSSVKWRAHIFSILKTQRAKPYVEFVVFPCFGNTIFLSVSICIANSLFLLSSVGFAFVVMLSLRDLISNGRNIVILIVQGFFCRRCQCCFVTTTR